MKSKNNKSSYEGLQKQIKNLRAPDIDVWQNQYQGKRYLIHLEVPEFTCICPKTGMPDFATIVIDYSPDRFCLELKSLKLYMNFYRDVGIFHEHLTNKILDDVVKACRPRYLKVTTKFNPRGGIYTTVTREHKK